MTYQLPLLDLTGNFPVQSVYSCPWSSPISACEYPLALAVSTDAARSHYRTYFTRSGVSGVRTGICFCCQFFSNVAVNNCVLDKEELIAVAVVFVVVPNAEGAKAAVTSTWLIVATTKAAEREVSLGGFLK
jgi:hypothetical protein